MSLELRAGGGVGGGGGSDCVDTMWTWSRD